MAELDSGATASELLDSTHSTELLDSGITAELLGSTGSLDVLEVPPQAANKAAATTLEKILRLFIPPPKKN
jgi:hypothetical protein